MPTKSNKAIQRKLIDLPIEVVHKLEEQATETNTKSLKAYIEKVLKLQAFDKPIK